MFFFVVLFLVQTKWSFFLFSCCKNWNIKDSIFDDVDDDVDDERQVLSRRERNKPSTLMNSSQNSILHSRLMRNKQINKQTNKIVESYKQLSKTDFKSLGLNEIKSKWLHRIFSSSRWERISKGLNIPKHTHTRTLKRAREIVMVFRCWWNRSPKSEIFVGRGNERKRKQFDCLQSNRIDSMTNRWQLNENPR